MGIFSRGRSKRSQAVDSDSHADAIDTVDTVDATDTVGAIEGAAAPAEPATPSGPLDRAAVTDDGGYLNLGAIWLKGRPGVEVRLEINEQEQQITGVTAVAGDSAVQLQAFAAPRTEGVWIDIRNELQASIVDAGGTAEVVTGEFGEELQTRMPQAGPDGRTVFMPARFVGVDGPRWFLRAVISGRAAVEPAAAEPVHMLIRTAVVDRGDQAMAPRELLPLRLPETPQNAEPQPAAPAEPPRVEDLNPFERGPEITEVR